MYTSSRRRPTPPSSFSSSFPAWPTNGRPCLSSWNPGASPTNIRSARALPLPNTTCVRPCASRQRVHAATPAAYAWSSSTCSTGTALTGANLPRAADGDDRRLPRAAGRVHLDLVALSAADDGAADRRLGRDAADGGELDRHRLAVLAAQLDDGADGRDARRRSLGLVDHLGVLEPVAEDRDPPLEQALLVL